MSDSVLNLSSQPLVSSFEAPQRTILFAYRGSVAHGMYSPKNDPNFVDDVDLMGLAVAPREHYFGFTEWGSQGTKNFWQGHYDCVWYELRKAVHLLLRGNPNILSLLWLNEDAYLYLEPEGRELLQHREWFVGKHVFESFAEYARAQLQRMESREPSEIREYMAVAYELMKRGALPTERSLPNELEGACSDWGTEKLLIRYRRYVRKGVGDLGDQRRQLTLDHGFNPESASHCIRMLRMCREFLDTGSMRVYRTDDAAELLAIKRGEMPLAEVKELASALFADLRAARDRSSLPEKPESAKVEALLIELIQNYLARTDGKR